MQTVKSVIGSAALVMLMAASSAMAESRTHRLKGDFAFSGSAVCVNSPATITPTSYTPPLGFSPNLTPIGFSFVSTFSIQGVRTFNGDGTGSVVARGVFLGNPGAANVQNISAQFTYSVAADGTVTIDQGPLDSVTVAGPGVGQQFRISDIPTFIGRLSSDRNSLTFATFNPGVETVTRLVPGPELVTAVRICHRARNAIRISRTPGSGGHGDD
jgi:hypothetical protein